MGKLLAKRLGKGDSRINDTVTQISVRSNRITHHCVTSPNATSPPMSSTRHSNPERGVKVEDTPHNQNTFDSIISDDVPPRKRARSRSIISGAATAMHTSSGRVKEEVGGTSPTLIFNDISRYFQAHWTLVLHVRHRHTPTPNMNGSDTFSRNPICLGSKLLRRTKDW